MDLNRLELSRRDFSTGNDEVDIMPAQFDLMKQYAKLLSKDFKFVRVDFYEIEDKPLLGEMTFTPGACIFKYKNPEDEIKIGNMLYLKDKDQYIVSLTSYPARIQYAAEAVKSLLKQKIDVDYKIVLVLAEPQFPGCKTPKEIQSLLKDRRLEILWHPTDIRSHKKLIPTLKKYPDATIIITDDDITRPDWWLQMFIDDHKKYPEDVIVGLSAWRLNKDMKQVGAAQVRPKNYMFPCVTEPEMILLTERPANGLGGVLYPKHTFKRTEFFDENLFMKLSPYSDESWQYCFNVIENKTLRLCSKPTDWSKFLIKGSQNTALSKHNSFSEYVRLYKSLMDEFPEYKENMIHRLEAYGTPVRLTTTKEEKKPTPVVICQLSGRLGNILFEIASASYYAKQYNMPIKYYFIQESGTDYDYFKRCSINNILKEPIELVSKKYALNSNLPVFDVPKEKSSITYT